jgi:hypothetical protein
VLGQRTVSRHLAPLAVAASAFLAGSLGSSSSRAAGTNPSAAHPLLEIDAATFGSLAEEGLAQTQRLWWNPSARWYRGQLANPQPASMWWSFPLLEASATVAIVNPTAANRQRVQEIFMGAERYWDPTLAGHTGGVAAGWGVSPSYHAYFDDAGWWGVAYLDAFRATANRRWLFDAARALNFIDRYGWDRRRGGVWWDTSHEKKTSEPLAAGMLIAATLYRIQRDPRYLEIATRYLAWADAHTRNRKQANLYGRNATDGTVMDYVQGMIIAAEVELCIGTKSEAYCRRAEELAGASLTQFPVLADWAPETDVIFLYGLLRLYQHDRDTRWYSIVRTNAARAVANARDERGLWMKRWDGGWTDQGRLYTQAATLELLALASQATP